MDTNIKITIMKENKCEYLELFDKDEILKISNKECESIKEKLGRFEDAYM